MFNKNNMTMKKLIFTTFIIVLFLPFGHGQTMNNQEAKQFLDKAWNYLKVSDSASFCNLWVLNDSISKLQRRPHSKKEIIGDFNMLRVFLDTALIKNLKIDFVDISNENLEGTDTKYWIQAWFKYYKGYYKGFGFYVAYMKNKWVVRDCPSTSTMQSNQTRKN